MADDDAEASETSNRSTEEAALSGQGLQRLRRPARRQRASRKSRLGLPFEKPSVGARPRFRLSI